MTDSQRIVRMGETVYPYGVGAIADIAGESFISMDTDWWPKESRSIECRRLEESLGAGLRVPPSVPDRPAKEFPGLTFLRFPAWRFCQNCRRMTKFGKRVGGIMKNECSGCGGPLVPMRFVAICDKGSHIQDIPWWWWAHRVSQVEEHTRCQEKSLLEFITVDDAGEGLASLRVICRACGVSRKLNELTGKGALARDGMKCSGKQPWQPEEYEGACQSEMHAIQRGSASTHIADIVSAIDIPNVNSPRNEYITKVREHSAFSGLEAAPDAPGADIRAQIIADDTGATLETVFSIARAGVAPLNEVNASLRGGEWAAFLQGLEGKDEMEASDFVVREEPFEIGSLPYSNLLEKMIFKVGGVQRIREVRAFTGFRRYSFEADLVRVDLGRKGGIPRWYPAAEQFGEGIFIQFSENFISNWETSPELIQRSELLEKRRTESNIGARLQPATPRYLLLHTLAHLLIRELAEDSGYSSASLRERIYAEKDGNDPQAGVLIYTASGDSEGTLGGLVRQAKSPHIGNLLLRCIEGADMCSNDPLCLESHGQGMNALNLAACHGCCLVSETSCENSNALLDRTFLVGDSENRGFFFDVLASARQQL